MSLTVLRQVAATIGYTVSRRDGEFRLAPNRPADRAWAEARAYYTTCAGDALDTLLAIRDGECSPAEAASVTRRRIHLLEG